MPKCVNTERINITEEVPPSAKTLSNKRYRDNRRKKVFERDGNKCLHCGTIENLTLDHIIPLSKGGSGKIDNLQTLCQPCNLKKADKI